LKKPLQKKQTLASQTGTATRVSNKDEIKRVIQQVVDAKFGDWSSRQWFLKESRDGINTFTDKA